MCDDFGLAMRLARVAVGRSQYQLAARVGIHPTTLNAIERGKKQASARLFRVVLDELKNGAPVSPLVTSILDEVEKTGRKLVRV